jgi:hypothetical protein
MSRKRRKAKQPINRTLFWEEERSKSAGELVEYLVVLRNHLLDNSKRKYPFYLYFHWRKMNERQFYRLCLAFGKISELETSHWEGILKSLYKDLEFEFRKHIFRFKDTKFFEFFLNVFRGSIPAFWPDTYKPNPREYPNFRVNLEQELAKIFTLRLETPRRVERGVFRRGYKDKGSAATTSERARRQANTLQSLPYQETLRYIVSHGGDPREFLRATGNWPEDTG